MYDLIVIGGGPAGLAAALEAYENGIENILIVERDNELGGILNQCIHNGFGLHRFKEELTGPEYAQKYIDMIKDTSIEYMLDSMVVEITKDNMVIVMNKDIGIKNIEAKAIILAMGCREKSRGALNIAGSRPSGIFSAGTVQRLVNINGYLPGKDVVILGSGDIGLIMARRMTLEGARVHVVAEIMETSSGLQRNIVQCLEDFDIPIHYNTTVSRIVGERRIEGVYLSKVDDNLKSIKESEIYYPCDTLLLSVGLIPENELSKQLGLDIDPKTRGPVVDGELMTQMPGVYACGNVLHVHDLVDNVSKEAKLAGANAADYIKSLVPEVK